VDDHPLGCHRPRLSDRDCFEVIVIRLATGCSWEDAERLAGNRVSDTTARSRRDEWVAAGGVQRAHDVGNLHSVVWWLGKHPESLGATTTTGGWSSLFALELPGHRFVAKPRGL